MIVEVLMNNGGFIKEKQKKKKEKETRYNAPFEQGMLMTAVVSVN